jgi:hypothetical protein
LIKINWAEYKEYKRYTHRDDNFAILLDFMKSYYNMSSPMDIYDVLHNDETAQLMLEKRKITDAEGLENFLFKLK